MERKEIRFARSVQSIVRCPRGDERKALRQPGKMVSVSMMHV